MWRAAGGTGVGGAVGAAIAAVADLVLPVRCGGCDLAGSRWCLGCRIQCASLAYPGGPRQVWPDPCPRLLPHVFSTSPYAGPLRTALVAYKDEGRRDLARVLAHVLLPALLAAARALHGRVGRAPPGRVGRAAPGRAGAMPVLLIPVPSSAAAVRRRGDRPLEMLLRLTVRCSLPSSTRGSRQGWLGSQSGPRGSCGGDAMPGWAVAPALTVRRGVLDQSGLDHHQRAENLAGAIAVRPRWADTVQGSVCVLVDDVMTTGATLAEAARAMHESGAVQVVAATVAATHRHTPGGAFAPAYLPAAGSPRAGELRGQVRTES